MAVDTMKGPTGAISGSNRARVHGVLLADPGSCRLPAVGTLTLAEWLEQQTERSEP